MSRGGRGGVMKGWMYDGRKETKRRGKDKRREGGRKEGRKKGCQYIRLLITLNPLSDC